MLNWWDRVLLRWTFYFRPAALGKKGEWVAQRVLIRKGMRIVARSMRNAYGEIDLVAVDKRTVVFVEVKTRSSDLAGEPAEAIDSNKQRHMTTAALAFLKSKHLLEQAARFDVVSLIWSNDHEFPEIEHIENAFEPTGEFQMFR